MPPAGLRGFRDGGGGRRAKHHPFRLNEGSSLPGQGPNDKSGVLWREALLPNGLRAFQRAARNEQRVGPSGLLQGALQHGLADECVIWQLLLRGQAEAAGTGVVQNRHYLQPQQAYVVSLPAHDGFRWNQRICLETEEQVVALDSAQLCGEPAVEHDLAIADFRRVDFVEGPEFRVDTVNPNLRCPGARFGVLCAAADEHSRSRSRGVGERLRRGLAKIPLADGRKIHRAQAVQGQASQAFANRRANDQRPGQNGCADAHAQCDSGMYRAEVQQAASQQATASHAVARKLDARNRYLASPG